MSFFYELAERARKAQQLYDRAHDVQLEIVPGMFAPAEWASEDEIAERRNVEIETLWERWYRPS